MFREFILIWFSMLSCTASSTKALKTFSYNLVLPSDLFVFCSYLVVMSKVHDKSQSSSLSEALEPLLNSVSFDRDFPTELPPVILVKYGFLD